MFNHAKITKILFPVLVLILFLANDSISLAQRCYTQQYSDNYYNSNPLSLSKKNEVEQLVEEKGYLLQQQSANPIIIPVVVHIIYNSSAENISDAQINSQIHVLNQDYRKLNIDVENTPELFYDRTADCNIEFRLAIYDPQGNPTTGITRTETDHSEFDPDDDFMKFSSEGGHDIWDRERYLNIWVCNIEDGILGYSSFPVWDPSKDGVVIDYEAFGTMGTSQAPYNLGRTAVHEVGHWFGLYHIWGDDYEYPTNDPSNDCEGDDFVYDTPNQATPNYGSPTFPHQSCNNESDIFMNYMDYVDDASMFMFTEGQKQKLQSTIFVSRSNLNPSLNLSENIINEVPESGGDYSFELQNLNPNNTINWSISKNVSWITNISPISGTNGTTVTFSISSNSTGLERAGIITIQTNDIYQTQLYVFVFQESGQTPIFLRLTQAQDQTSNPFGSVGLYRMGKWKTGSAPKYYPVDDGQPLTMKFSYGFVPNTHSKFYVVRHYSDIIGYENLAYEYPSYDDYRGGFISAWDATLQNNYPELSGVSVSTNGTQIGFKDPWYTDLTTDIGGKNRGLQAIYHYKSLPFEIKYNDNDYKGVFLGQGYEEGEWVEPYYSVKAVSPPPINVQGKTRNFYFQKWESSGATFQNINSIETPIVFNNANATVKAVMKGTGLSNNANAYTNNSQRKFVRSANGDLWNLYESLGSTWLERSSDNGSTWDLAKVSINTPPFTPVFSDANMQNASICLSLDGDKIGVVYQKYNEYENKKRIGVRIYEIDATTNLLEIVSSYTIEGDGYGNDYLASTLATPVISSGYQGFNVAWVGTNNGGSNGIYYAQFSNSLELLSGIIKIPDTNSGSINPTIAGNDSRGSHLVWQQNNEIHYSRVWLGCAMNGCNTIVEDYSILSDGSGYTTNTSPSIVTSNSTIFVTWDGGNKIIKRDGTIGEFVSEPTVWSQTFNYYGGNNPQNPQVRIVDSEATIAWSEDNLKLKLARGSNLWSFSTNGNYVQLADAPNLNSMYCSVFNTSSQPYTFTTANKDDLNSILPTTISSNTIASGNITVSSNTTINSGATLTIESCTNLTFQNGSYLKVNGTLNVNGTSSNKVTFDFVSKNSSTQNGIRTSFYADVNINNAVIKNAYRGLNIQRSNLTFNNSEIKNCTFGLLMYYVDPSVTTNIITNSKFYDNSTGVYLYDNEYVAFSNNELHDNNYGLYVKYSDYNIFTNNEFDGNYTGAYLYYSNGQFSHNEFHGYQDEGLRFYHSSPTLAVIGTATGHNNIHENFVGIEGENNSNPFLGRVTCIDNGG